MNWKKITLYFSLSSLVIILAYDVFAIMKGGTEASISHLIITFAYKFPLMPFMSGVLIGHLFWRMKSTPDTLKTIDKPKE